MLQRGPIERPKKSSDVTLRQEEATYPKNTASCR